MLIRLSHERKPVTRKGHKENQKVTLAIQNKRKKGSCKQNKGVLKISAKTGSKRERISKSGRPTRYTTKTTTPSCLFGRPYPQDEPIFSEITTEGFVDGGYLDERLIEQNRFLKAITSSALVDMVAHTGQQAGGK